MGSDPRLDERTPSRPAASRQRDERALAAAHDLRGALAVVVGRAQLLMRHVRTSDDPSPARLLAGLTEIERAARRAVARLERLEGDRGKSPRDSGDWHVAPADREGEDGRPGGDAGR